MGIYLGNVGNIELTRKTLEGSQTYVIKPSDINTNRDRFSFDIDPSLLISGDLVEFATTDGSNLAFVDASGWVNSTVQPSGNWYVFVDELGGIKLYSTFDASLDGGPTNLIPLVNIGSDISVKVSVRGRDTRLIASVTEYELNTNRETVDITTLSDEHRQQYSSLISGSGRLTAHWDYSAIPDHEPVQYLLQLVLRTEIGSAFNGKFYIKYPNTVPQTGDFTVDQVNDALWWEFDALVTASAVSFTSDSMIVATIDFVSTGTIRLKTSTQPKRYLLQEDDFKISQEQNADAFLLLEETE